MIKKIIVLIFLYVCFCSSQLRQLGGGGFGGTDSIGSVFGRTGNITAEAGDYQSFYPLLTDIRQGAYLSDTTKFLNKTDTLVLVPGEKQFQDSLIALRNRLALQSALAETASVLRSQIPDTTSGRNHSNNLYLAKGTAKDTMSKGYTFDGGTVADSTIFWICDQSGLTIDSILVYREGGTSASINVVRIRSGSSSDLISANFATASRTWLDTHENVGALQNNTLLKGDKLGFCIRAQSGATTRFLMQINFSKVQL